MVRIGFKDFAAWFGIIIAIFVVFLIVGNFGNYLEPISPTAVEIGFIYKIIFYGAGVIFSLFLGTLIFFTIKFWDKRGD